MTPKDQVSIALRARDPSTQLASLATKYAGGSRGDNVHLAYAQALYRARDERFDSVARAYLDTQSDWTEKPTMELVLQTAETFNDPYYQEILKHKFLYIKAYGEGLVYGRLLHMLEQHFFEEIDKVKLSEVKQQYAEIFPTSKKEQFYDNFELSFYDRTNRKEKYIEAAKQYVKKYPNLSWSALNGLAWPIYEKNHDEKALKLATRWAKKSIEIQNNHYNNDTLAALYYKQGKEKPARKYAERAIELAKAAKADYSTTSELLERINAMS